MLFFVCLCCHFLVCIYAGLFHSISFVGENELKNINKSIPDKQSSKLNVSFSDDDECTLNTDNCDTNAACTNTAGSFTCACNSGYSGDGTTCTGMSGRKVL
jgi:hypothetical protein